MGNTPTPLRHAIREDDINYARFILDKAGDKAADVINQDYSPDCVMQSCSRVEGNALYYAVDRNRLEIVKLLLERGADVYTTGHYGETCLHNAARHNQVLLARALMAAGADLYATDDQGRLPIHSTGLSHFNTSAMITYLLEEVGQKEDVNRVDFHSRSALHEAAFAQNLEVIGALAAAGADLGLQSKEGNSPLHGVRRGTPAWDLLVSLGADVNVKNKNGELPGEVVT